jgi:hypothetical protein
MKGEKKRNWERRKRKVEERRKEEQTKREIKERRGWMWEEAAVVYFMKTLLSTCTIPVVLITRNLPALRDIRLNPVSPVHEVTEMPL